VSSTTNTLWYKQPARNWNESLPLGNGRLGANVFGGIQKEIYTLNEDTLWCGYPRTSAQEGMPEVYKKIQALALDGKLQKAQELSESAFSDFLIQSYMPFGDLTINMPHSEKVSRYNRSLSLRDAVHKARYYADDTGYRRECFISPEAQVLCIRLSASMPAKINFSVDLSCKMKSQKQFVNDGIIITGNCPVRDVPLGISDAGNEKYKVYSEDDSKKGIGFCGMTRVKLTGGTLTAKPDGIRAENADEAYIYFAIRTSFNGFNRHPVMDGAEYINCCREELNKAFNSSYTVLLREHIKSHKKLYERMRLTIEGAGSKAPTDERLKKLHNGESDNHLYVLMFNYARYLMICGSREGTQPMNLQGIWNHKVNPPWSSNYTMNINTQMNYWPALQGNLAECLNPLLKMVEELAENGRETARRYYGAGGTVCHHATDLWRASHPSGAMIPGNCQWSFWNISGGWLCSYLYDYYCFTGNKEFLREKGLPLMEEFALFYSQLLIEDADGALILCPSTSPENSYYYEDEDGKTRTSVAKTAAMSMTVIRELFKNAIKAGDILGVKSPIYKRITEQLPKLKPYQITKDGRISEWDDLDCRESEPEHRHLSHLYGLYPGNEIHYKKNPELAIACEKVLQSRGDKGTGWSLAWKVNLWARLGNGEKALELLTRQLIPVSSEEEDINADGGIYPNMFCACPPFQIDGNFGAASGIMQMLFQYDGNEPHFLPALPCAWNKGCVRGMRFPGGTADFSWENGKLKFYRIYNQ